MRGIQGRIAAASLAGCAIAIALLTVAVPSAADGGPTPSLKIVGASIGNHSIMSTSTENPLPIDPKVPAQLTVTLTNNGSVPVHVRYLRLSGAVMGIHFVNYQASTSADIDPGATDTVTSPGDFFDVDGVARGLVNGTLQVVDDTRATVASQAFVADVHGKFASSEGLFLGELFIVAAVSLVDIGLGVARRRLPRNRFVCGLLFAFAAATTVLTIVVLAAMFRVALFESTAWVPALFVATAASFVLGYISPSRLVRTAPEAAEDSVIDLVAAGAVARATGEQERRRTGGVASPESGDHNSVDLTAQQHSGEFSAPSHHSGEFSAPSHQSGEFVPPSHQSGEYSPVPPQESGTHKPTE